MARKVTIGTDDCEPSPAAIAEIRTFTAAFVSRWPALTACHVRVRHQHRHHAPGEIYRLLVDLDTATPEAPHHSTASIHEDLGAALSIAFSQASRALARTAEHEPTQSAARTQDGAATFLIALFASLVMVGSAIAASRDTVAGQGLAEGLCARCHNVHADDLGSWTDAPAFKDIANRREMTRDHLMSIITQPHMDMLMAPYTHAQAESIADYILSLGHK
jgi:mono/diheme cytochrome c family protein